MTRMFSSGRNSVLALLVVLSTAMLATSLVWAGGSGFFVSNRAVGGVKIDSEGVLTAVPPQEIKQLAEFRRQNLGKPPEDLGEKLTLRKISLKRLQETLRNHHAQIPTPPLPREMQLLGGLQRIEFVIVDPERHDIILAGPGEAWKVADDGTVVGKTTGRPVLLLDDLLIALRVGDDARKQPLTCSIDPTEEGLAALDAFVSKQQRFNQAIVEGIEQALGPQKITIGGLPGDSHFAAVMVAADWRMKRIAMGFESPPVRGLPSYLQMAGTSTRGASNMLPRWWLTTNYEPLARDKEGLTWQIRGQGVKAMSETDLFVDGKVQRGAGRGDKAVARWAENMTKHYDALSEKVMVFAELRNCMDLAVVAALLLKEDLPGKAGLSLDYLLDERKILHDRYATPKQVATQASALRKGRGWLISASGGVEIQPWEPASRSEERDMGQVRQEATAGTDQSSWRWN